MHTQKIGQSVVGPTGLNGGTIHYSADIYRPLTIYLVDAQGQDVSLSWKHVPVSRMESHQEQAATLSELSSHGQPPSEVGTFIIHPFYRGVHSGTER